MSTQDFRVPHDDWMVRNVVHIAHGDAFRALDLELPRLKAVKAAADKKDWAGAYEAWDAYFRGRKKHLGFFEPAEFRTLVAERPRELRKIRKTASELCDHRICWYGHRVAQFGDVVNFSPGTDRSALYGFHYWYWAYPLLFAYVLDGGDRYVTAFDELFNQWYDQRDSVEWRIKGTDPIWYELGLCRVHRFIAFYSLMRDEPGLGPVTRQRLLRSLLGHGRALYRLVKGARIGNNFNFNSNLSLTHLALAMPEFRESAKWIRECVRSLLRLLKNAVYPDGGFTERCPSYASFSLGFATEVYRLLAGHPEYASAREEIGELLRRCYEWYMHIITPLGEFPPVGDSRTRSAAPMLSVGIAALDLDDLFATIAPNLPRVKREQLPLQYSHRAREADLSARKVRPDALPEQASRHFPHSAWSVMRTNWKPTAPYLVINHGPRASHAHQEALAFNMYAFGEPQALELDLAVTRGYADPFCRSVRASRSHNMVVLDDESVESAVDVPDLWAGKDVVWHSDAQVDYFEAWHEGYRRTKGAIIKRKIVFVKPYFWLVHDRVLIERPRRAKMAHWYLHACHPFVSRRGRWASTGKRSRLNVVAAGSQEHLACESGLESHMEPEFMENGMYCNYYPDRYWMRLSQPLVRAARPHDFCVVLYPQRKADRARIAVEEVAVPIGGRPAPREQAQAWRITHGRREHLIVLNHGDAANELEVDGCAVAGRACVSGAGVPRTIE